MELPSRFELKFAPWIGVAVRVAALVLAAVAGAHKPALRGLLAFAFVFPLLWVGLMTILSFGMVRALRLAGVDMPGRARAGENFQVELTLSLSGYGFPAIGVLTNARFALGDVAIESGPFAELPILEIGRAGLSKWDVFTKRRGLLVAGPFRATVELPGSLVRATAIFEGKHTVTVLPALYQLQPFVDMLLAGRHLAVGRYQKLPTATEEYVGAREYRPGDSPKLIHRVLSLRAPDPNQFYVREFQDPSRDDLSLVLDTATPLDGDDTVHAYRFEKAICFVSALCRTFLARRLTVRFIYQRGARDVAMLRLRPLDADVDRLETELSRLELGGDRATLGRVLIDEVRHYGSAVIFVSLRPREPVGQQRLPIVTLTPEHVPVFTREIAWQ
jgi:uncharacterized protein (DUF58 family)